MKKKIIVLLVVVCMLIAMVPVTALAHGGNHDVHDHENIATGIRVRIEAGAGGTIYSPSNQTGVNLSEGATWTFKAVPDSGYQFDHWTYNGNAVSGAFLTPANDDDLSVKFVKDGWGQTGTFFGMPVYGFIGTQVYKAQAVFVPVQQSVTLDLGAGGTFNASGTSTVTLTGYPGDTLTVPAYTLNTGYSLSGWSSALNFNETKTVSAVYEYLITFAGNTHITITGGSPVWTVNQNATAPSYTVDSGYRFNGWDRSLSGFTAPATVTANAAVAQAMLTLSATEDGTLLFESNVEGIYDVGDTVDLDDAGPHPTIRFLGWRKDSTGDMISGSEIQIAASGNAYTAVFGKYLDTSAAAHGSLGNDLDGFYERGTDVNLNDANPTGDTGYELDCWREFDGTQWAEYYGFGRVVELDAVTGEPIVTIGGQNIFRAFFKLAQYSIVYDLDSGSVATANPVSYNMQSAAITLNNPEKTGYTFAGWTGTGLSGPTMTVTIASGSTGDRSYTATWTAHTYTVTYDINGGDSGTTADSAHVYDVAKNLTANGFAKTGYTFAGWATTAGGPVAYTDAQSVTNLSDVDGDTVTLFAVWTANTYTVTYDINGGDSGTTADSVHTYDAAKNLTANGFAKTGYTFAGWATTAGGPVAYTDAQSVINLTAVNGDTVELFAVWTANTYTVTYDINGGDSGATADSAHVYDEAKTLTANGFTKTGYTFAGWATTAGGSMVYTDAQSVINLTSVDGDTVTLYAVWTANTYTVTYDINGGDSGTTADSAHVYDQAKTLTANGFSKTGYTFAGWATAADGDVAYTDLQSVLNLTDVDGGTVTLYAVWTANTYTVTYDINDGNGGSTADSVHTYDTAKTLTANGFTRTGYSFTGWATAADGDVVYADAQSVINLTDVNGDTIKLFAVWEINRYTVTFRDFDGTLLGRDTTEWGTAAQPPAIPEREGYTFVGWSDSIDPVIGYLTVTAVYEINTFTVQFVDFDGSPIETQTVDWDTAATAPADPEREGYDFIGWDTDFDHVQQDLTVTAQYEQTPETLVEPEAAPEQTPAPAEPDTERVGSEDVPEAGGGVFPWWWIVVAVGGAGLLALLLWLLFKRRKKEEE